MTSRSAWFVLLFDEIRWRLPVLGPQVARGGDALHVFLVFALRGLVLGCPFADDFLRGFLTLGSASCGPGFHALSGQRSAWAAP